MKKKKKVGVRELYNKDSLKANKELWGEQESDFSRRGFLSSSALLAMGTLLGGKIVFGENKKGRMGNRFRSLKLKAHLEYHGVL